MHVMMEQNVLLRLELVTAKETVAATQKIATAIAERMSTLLVQDIVSNTIDF